MSAKLMVKVQFEFHLIVSRSMRFKLNPIEKAQKKTQNRYRQPRRPCVSNVCNAPRRRNQLFFCGGDVGDRDVPVGTIGYFLAGVMSVTGMSQWARRISKRRFSSC